MIKRFFLYGFSGWCLEIIFTGLDSLIHGDLRLIGFTNLWMFAIYGLAILFEPLHDRISHWNWPWRGLFWLTLIWAMEYFTGLFLVITLGVYPWRYTDPYAVDGLITLRFAPVWFIGGLLFEKVHRFLDTMQIVRYKK